MCVYALSGRWVCHICSDYRRVFSTVCVVENIRDVMSIENTHQYNGVYHVLGGIISPMEGIGPSDLHISALIDKISDENSAIKEIILALAVKLRESVDPKTGKLKVVLTKFIEDWLLKRLQSFLKFNIPAAK